jgi:hypothetical protein
MKKLIVVFCLGLVVLAVIAGWQFGAYVLANVELRDDMQDMSSQLGSRIGLTEPRSDEDFRQAILRHAQKHGIELNSEQITLRRTGPDDRNICFAATYTRVVHLPGITFTLHFNPEAGTK